MSYSESGIDILFFSSDRDTLQAFNDEFREHVDTKGGEYKGPFKPKTVSPGLLHSFLLHINDPEAENTGSRDDYPDWLFDALDSEAHLETMIDASWNEEGLFARRYEIMGDHVVSSVLSVDVPEEVMTVATTIKKTHRKGNKSPYTWNPNVDHIPSHPDGPW